MKNETAIIRTELRKRGFKGSVTQGKGTACTWVHIRGSGEFGGFTEQERAILKEAGICAGGNFAPLPSDEQPLIIARLQGREPDPADVRNHESQENCRMWD